MQPELRQHLDSVASRLRMKRMWTGVATLWGLFACLVLVTYFGSGSIVEEVRLQLDWLLYAVCGLSFLWVTAALQFTPSSTSIARGVEKRFPDLNSSLITAVEQQPNFENGGFTFLQQSVINKAAQHAMTHEWKLVVSNSQMNFWRSAATLGVIVAFITLAALPSKTTVARNNSQQPATEEEVVHVQEAVQIAVDPGDTEVEKGQSLLVRATFSKRVPSEATLVTWDDRGEEKLIPMAKSLEDPVFGGRISGIVTPLKYAVRFEEKTSETYRISVFEFPECLRADAELTFPQYTKMPPKMIQNVRRITAVEGTTIRLTFELNKPVVDGRLVPKSGDAISIKPISGKPNEYSAEFAITESNRYELLLKDDHGRANKVPPVFHLRMLENRPPDLKLAQPSRDVQVSPLEELSLLATARDDFGLTKVGIDLQIPGQPMKSIELGSEIAAKIRAEFPHLVAFEELEAKPDQLLTYYFWAEDVDGQGNARRVSSDMFFAEVRPFEEIFRQGQQPPNGQQQQQQQQQGSQNAQQAEQLAELQKQIINSTWKVIRRETRDEVTQTFGPDVEAIRDGQQSALEQLNKLAEKLTDAKSLSYVDETKNFMNNAIVSLNEAKENSEPKKLTTVLGDEQAAYQSLLKLRAREHQVVQQQQSQQSGKSQQQSKNNRAQQQLNQMKLKENENRYATESQAGQQEPQQAREDRQVLNRLKELSQRQSDLNDRIKDLKKEIEEAKTETEKKAAERQLKRLLDEQKQILRDTEELQQRMQQPENQERMQQQQQKMEQVRENVRQASEALEKGMVNRAANEGTRAENDLKDLKDEFQKRTSQHFQEQLRDLKKQSEDVKKAEKEIAKALNNDKKNEKGRPSLEENDQKGEVQQAIQQQKEDVKKLVEKVRETIEDAEDDQPLLAEELYETLRDLRRQDPEKALEMTEAAFKRGFVKEAQEAEKVADKGIERLAKGIDKAAERVLKGDAESLKRALDEIDKLSKELNGELAQATGQPSPNGKGEPNDSSSKQQDSKTGTSPGKLDPKNSEQKPGENKPGENQQNKQQGENSPSDQKPQEGQQGQPMNSQQNAEGKGRQPQDSQNPSQQKGNPSEGSQPNPMGGQNSQSQNPQSQHQSPGQPSQQQREGSQGGKPQTGNQRTPANQNNQSNPSGSGGGGGLERLLNTHRDSKAPIAGADFMDWSDRLRDVEELVTDPELRAEAARIRDRATAIRKELKRHSEPPNWDVVREKVAEPLAELQDRVAEELLKLSSKKALVPIDRDPVPPKFDEDVRRYYEQLGSSRR